MGKILTYKEGRYSTIQLDSGEKMMLSIAQTGIAIFKMKFLGLLPGKKITEWSLAELPNFIELLGGQSSSGSPFQFTVNKISTFGSIKEFEAFLQEKK